MHLRKSAPGNVITSLLMTALVTTSPILAQAAGQEGGTRLSRQGLANTADQAAKYGVPLDQSLGQPETPEQNLAQPKYGAPLDQSLNESTSTSSPPNKSQSPMPPAAGTGNDTTPPAPPRPAPNPILTPPSSLIDLSSASFGRLDIDLTDAQFKETSMQHAHLSADDMNFRNGILRGLDIRVSGGKFEQFVFDQMLITTSSEMQFSPSRLLADHVLELKTPVRADVSVMVSQPSLNQFLAAPKTLARSR